MESPKRKINVTQRAYNNNHTWMNNNRNTEWEKGFEMCSTMELINIPIEQQHILKRLSGFYQVLILRKLDDFVHALQ